MEQANRARLTVVPPPDGGRHAALRAIEEALGRINYGTVQLTIHDGRVVQLEVTERQRF